MKKRLNVGFLRHILTFFALCTFFVGSIVIGYVAWVLSTSVSIQRFQSGTLVLTYILISIGFTLFFTGLIGWVAGASETPCILHLFLIVEIFATMGAFCLCFISAGMRIDLEDVLKLGWLEVNQSTRNLVQSSLDCCGFNGPKEFAENAYHIDESCYEMFKGGRRLKQARCKDGLEKWFRKHKSIWIGIIIAFFLVQVLSIGSASFSIHYITRKRKRRKRINSRGSLNRELYGASFSTDGTAIEEACHDSL